VRCHDMEIPDSLAKRMALFRDNALAYQAPDELFRIDSWVQVLLGQGLQPRGYHQVARMMPPGQLRQALTDLKAGIAGAVAKMPNHQEFLDHYCAAPAA